MNFEFSAAVRTIADQRDYGVAGAVSTRPVDGRVGRFDQRMEFAKAMHQRPRNVLEYDRVLRMMLVGPDSGMIAAAAATWPNDPDVLAEWDRLDGHEARDEVADGLPTKQRWLRDIYNVGLDAAHCDPDERLRAFRLYGEGQGFIGGGKGSTTNVYDNRSIILVPRRGGYVDDPDREQKIVNAQAKLIVNAKGP